ncbi:MAG: tetratricopeptide repeat protein [Bacteroidales bacterium]|nr:tetratricopeptide repeat protein [Bacteroidales bacterium]
MKTRRLILAMFLVLMTGFAACHRGARSIQEAETLFQQGVEQRANKQSEAAAGSFSRALLAIERCDMDKPEVQRLKAQVEDQLGAMYWKHGLAEEALTLHVDAVAVSRKLDEPKLLMTALRNCGRVTASLQRIDEARAYYEESKQIAEKQNDRSFCNELLMETSHDLYLENGDYTQAIENASRALAGGAEQGFCNLVIGLSYYYLDENDTALVFLHEASQSEKPSVRMSAYQALYLIYQNAGDYQQALQCHELFNENMSQADRQFRSEEVQRIKGEYDLQMQKNTLQAEQKLKSLYLYLVLIVLLVVLAGTLLLLRQRTLSSKLKSEEMKNQLEVALKKNKVYVTALALTEQITASTLDFDLSESEWDDFVTLIDKVYGNFTQRLMAQYPTLNKSDLQICCLTRQGFSNQVISILMNIQTSSYARRKSRIKQEKMNGLNDERSFEEIINSL